MRTSWSRSFALLAMCVVGFACLTQAAQATGSADRAIRDAARQHRYIFITFYKPNDNASQAMLASVQSLQGKFSNRADFVSVSVNDPANRQLVARYGVDRSPIPLTIVVAPNGAVTAGFPRQIHPNTDFSHVFISTGQADVLKVLQASRLAVVCVQSPRTRYNRECRATANAVKSDQRLGGAVEVVTINPTDPAEAKFLQQSGINTRSADAQLVVIDPSGKVVGTYTGNTPPATVMANLTRSLGGGCSGGKCGPGGCGGK